MPNWVYNTLVIEAVEADPEQLKKVATQLNQPYTVSHHTWDAATDTMVRTPTTYNNPIFAFWNISKPTDLDAYFGEQPKFDPEKPVAFDSDHWYDWNVRNWGTKWDVGNQDNDSPYNDTEMEERERALVYTFNTAWSTPMPALITLSEQYPELVIALFYQEETGWGGNAVVMNGKVVDENQYDSLCQECDEKDCMEYCDNDCGEICSACGWLGEADLEAVALCDNHKGFLDAEHLPEYRLVDKS
jgi:hypothetical protein